MIKQILRGYFENIIERIIKELLEAPTHKEEAPIEEEKIHEETVVKAPVEEAVKYRDNKEAITQQEKEEIKEEVIRLYKETGLSMEKIAFKVGCGYSTVSTILKEAGIKANKFKNKFNTTDFKEEVIRLYKKTGSSMEKIGLKVGCSQITVSRILKEAGINTIKKPRKMNILNEQQKEEVIRLYKETGLSMEKIGLKVGCSCPTVSRILKEVGINTNKFNITEQQKKEIIRLYKKTGLRLLDIAYKVGCSEKTVRKTLKEANINYDTINKN